MAPVSAAAPAPKTKQPAAAEKAAAGSTKPKAAAAKAAATTPKPAAKEASKQPAAAEPATAAEPTAARAIRPSAAIKLVEVTEQLMNASAEAEESFRTWQEKHRILRKLREPIARHLLNAKKAEAVRVEKAKKKQANGNSDGLKQPALASDALNAFMGNPPGTMVPRQAAAKFIRDYIAANNLKNGANFRVDTELAKLFPGQKEILNFHLNVHMKDLFTKKAKKTD